MHFFYFSRVYKIFFRFKRMHIKSKQPIVENVNLKKNVIVIENYNKKSEGEELSHCMSWYSSKQRLSRSYCGCRKNTNILFVFSFSISLFTGCFIVAKRIHSVYAVTNNLKLLNRFD